MMTKCGFSCDLREVLTDDEKSSICDSILRLLPSWFGIESSIVEYVSSVRQMPFFAAYSKEKPIGFVALKLHNEFAAEVCVMGILIEFHRLGIGKALVNRCEDYCREREIQYLTVKTLDGSHPSKSYARTRQFYQSMGFVPLEVFKTLWDENNPCLFMAKCLK